MAPLVRWNGRVRLRLSRAFVFLTLGLLSAGPGPAQEVKPGQLPTVGVELVQLDVVVTDKQGRPVSGLSALDFEVKEDGKGQTLAYFGVEGARRSRGRASHCGPPAQGPAPRPGPAPRSASGPQHQGPAARDPGG